MKPLLAILAALTLTASPALIVPGEWIGPARLGSTRDELSPLLQDAHCPIRALFHQGRTVQLFTNCGGAWATPGGTQVGLPLLWAVREFGQPATTARGDAYTWPGGRTARAVWYMYPGIALRAVVPEGEPDSAGVITCITVHRDSSPVLPVLSESCGQ